VKILWVQDHQGTEHGGGVISTDLLAKGLMERGHSVACSYSDDLDFPGAYWVRRGVEHHRFARKTATRARSFDIVVVQGEAYPEVVRAVRDVPTVVFVRDHHYRCPFALHYPCPGSCRKCLSLTELLQAPLIFGDLGARKQTLHDADMVVTNSLFMREELQMHVGVVPEVVYPPVDTKKLQALYHRPRYVLFAGNGEWKGTETMLSLAAKFQDIPFLVCGWQKPSHVLRMERLPNVFYHRWMRREEMLRQVRLLIAPVTWPEPFGRVPVECAVLGVPTIASAMGGLPEAVGAGGVLVPKGAGLTFWEADLRDLWDDYEWRHELGRRALRHAKRFDVEVQVSLLEERLEGLL
jgi:glycosyltransferase involved in cell wall biosynthesis